MKKLIVFLAAAGLAGSAFAQGSNISAPTVRRQTLPPVNHAAQSEGSLQRGVRLGNPLQMFNPAAPAVYGDGHEFVVRSARDEALHPHEKPSGKVVALRLFTIAF